MKPPCPVTRRAGTGQVSLRCLYIGSRGGDQCHADADAARVVPVPDVAAAAHADNWAKLWTSTPLSLC